MSWLIGGSLAQVMALAAGTLASEDLTCISAGLLIRQRMLHPATALLGCFAGIFLGDLGLWGAGRLLGRRLLEHRWIARRLPQDLMARAGAWLDGNLPGAVLASRFMPGTRLPLYFAAGTLGRRPWRFTLWTLIAAMIWTPLLVLAAASFGHAATAPLQAVAGPGWRPAVAAAALLLLAYRSIAQALMPMGRWRLIARASRLWRWEFWPAWVFYPPVALWIGLLSLRYRGFSTITAANPAIPDGGFVGESKHRILSSLPAPWALPSALIEPGDPAKRVAALRRSMAEGGWRFPIILKPDAGQRGAGVKLVRDAAEAEAYLTGFGAPVIAQQYHPGPYEAGIFYYRMPEEAHGRIFSITDKVFPELMGDGSSTVEELIWRHPRFRMQARTFIERLGAGRGRVLAREERQRLCLAGNHAQGTMFRDGSRLLTPELEEAIDRIARGVPGFYFGRFDVRYANEHQIRSGRDFAIVELNGVTSESTDIYDPSGSLARAYATLCRQWWILFRIGDANRRRGCKATPLAELAGRVIDFYRRRPLPAPAD